LQLNQDLKLVTQRIIELGDKETVTKEDLPYIISDVLDSQSFKKES
jgi:D-citramalate synthase